MNIRNSILLIIIATLGLSTLTMAGEVEITYDNLVLRADWENPGQEQEAVLLLHGTMAHKDMEIIQALQDGLTDNEINSLAITLSLGKSGRSGMFPCAEKQTHLYTDALAELALWINWLQQQGISRIWLLGHSRGANQLTTYALSHPKQLMGLILVAPPVINSAQLATNYNKSHTKSLAAVISMAEKEGQAGELLGVGFLHCQAATVSATSFLSYYRDAKHNTVAMLKQIGMPILLISGTEDKVSAGVGAAGRKLKKDNVSLLEIEGANHFFRDLYADEIVDGILELMVNTE